MYIVHNTMISEVKQLLSYSIGNNNGFDFNIISYNIATEIVHTNFTLVS